MLLGLLIVCLFIYAVFAVYIQIFAKDHLTHKLREAISPHLTLENLSYRFPLGPEIRNLSVPGRFHAERIRLPVIIPAGDHFSSFLIPQIHILNAVYTGGGIEAHHLQATLQNITLPALDSDASFTLNGLLTVNALQTALQAHGTLNWKKRNLNADGSIRQKDSKNNVTARLEAVANNLTAQGTMKMEEPLKEHFSGNALLQALDNYFQQAFQNGATAFTTHFSFKTKLDHPEVDTITFSGALAGTPKKN